MQKIISSLLYGFVWAFSKLPFPILYAASDIIYLLIYYVIGYRKKMVHDNIKSFFPEKTEKEIKVIEKKFYRHFVDIFIEMIKSFTIPLSVLDKRFTTTHEEILHELYEKGKSVIVMGAHYANWEWGLRMGVNLKFHSYGTYTRIRNKFIEQKIKETRSRFGVELLLKQHTIKKILKNKQENKLSIYALLSDQSPQISRSFYWATFLGQRVPIHTGAEMLARKNDFAVVFIDISKKKRGYYNCDFVLHTENPNDLPEYKITDDFLKHVEHQIKREPTYYFWTHNRFKHVGKEHLKPNKPN